MQQSKAAGRISTDGEVALVWGNHHDAQPRAQMVQEVLGSIGSVPVVFGSVDRFGSIDIPL
eukprot:15433391-Alexandrium_andersonii.AAC.1